MEKSRIGHLMYGKIPKYNGYRKRAVIMRKKEQDKTSTAAPPPPKPITEPITAGAAELNKKEQHILDEATKLVKRGIGRNNDGMYDIAKACHSVFTGVPRSRYEEWLKEDAHISRAQANKYYSIHLAEPWLRSIADKMPIGEMSVYYQLSRLVTQSKDKAEVDPIVWTKNRASLDGVAG
jgi:hypothetical protein